MLCVRSWWGVVRWTRCPTFSSDALEWRREHLDGDGSDLRREMVRTFAERLMACEVDVLCNAGCGAAAVGHVGEHQIGRVCCVATGPVREDSTRVYVRRVSE